MWAHQPGNPPEELNKLTNRSDMARRMVILAHIFEKYGGGTLKMISLPAMV
jgi:hypothetical protein